MILYKLRINTKITDNETLLKPVSVNSTPPAHSVGSQDWQTFNCCHFADTVKIRAHHTAVALQDILLAVHEQDARGSTGKLKKRKIKR